MIIDHSILGNHRIIRDIMIEPVQLYNGISSRVMNFSELSENLKSCAYVMYDDINNGRNDYINDYRIADMVMVFKPRNIVAPT